MDIPKGLPAVRGFIPVSLNEWDGRIAAVLFLGGCNLHCPYCHGWRFVTKSEEQPEIPAADIGASLESNRGWVDGAVVTGGEPTLAPGLTVLIDWLRGTFSLGVKLHTNGTNPRLVSMLLAQRALDCLAMDYKAPLTRDRYRQATGMPKLDIEPIRETFRMAGAGGIPTEFHTTLCPAVLALDDLKQMAQDLAAMAPGGRWILQQYEPGDVLDEKTAGTQRENLTDIEITADALKSIYPGIEVRGRE